MFEDRSWKKTVLKWRHNSEGEESFLHRRIEVECDCEEI